ncbi:MAG: AMP-binding protein, partial [Mesorhizobium sp.]
MAADAPLWTPTQDRIDAAPMTAFMKAAAAKAGTSFASYAELHRWSIDDREAFWALVWDFCGIVGEKGERVLVDGDLMPGAAFFPDAKLNFAENLLKKTGPGAAIVFRGEDKVERRLSWNELHALTSRLQQLFLSLGVKKGDRIAAMMPNMPEAVAAMLATASIGAVWSSCSPDFGEQGVLDRFGQIEPVVFIAPDGYWYNGKAIEVADKIAAVAAKLGTVRKILIVDYLGTSADVAETVDKAAALEEALSPFAARPVTFERLPFEHPLYILFSSGTTGIPKCIVHSAGGTLIQHVKEHRLHAGLADGDRFFYFTTCGWMMWNWLV